MLPSNLKVTLNSPNQKGQEWGGCSDAKTLIVEGILELSSSRALRRYLAQSLSVQMRKLRPIWVGVRGVAESGAGARNSQAHWKEQFSILA